MSLLEPPQVDERTARLPQWAQEIIVRLRRAVGERDQRIREMKRDVKNPDTFLQRGWNDEEALPRGATVRFMVDAGSRDYIEVRLLGEKEGGPGIQIMGGDMIKVAPRSGNVVHVSVER